MTTSPPPGDLDGKTRSAWRPGRRNLKFERKEVPGEMWHTHMTRGEQPKMYFDQHEEMWRPQPARSRVLARRESLLQRSSSRVLSTHRTTPTDDNLFARHYVVLNLPKGCVDTELIRRAYLKMSRRHHPDRGGDAAHMAKVSAARDALMQRAQQSRWSTTNSTYGADSLALLRLKHEPPSAST